MTGLTLLGAAVALGLSALTATAQPAEPLGDCAARLDRTLAEMESRPLLKEELATGLMWIRLDARTALDEGDVEGCLGRVRTVEQILGLMPPPAE